VNLAWWENGFRNLTNSVRPITSLEDFQGMRVRVMQNNIFLDTFQTLGANATPMAFGEVFTALETKAIDAQENPYVTIDTSQFYEVQDYLSATRHAYTPFMVLFSKPIYDTYLGRGAADPGGLRRESGATSSASVSRELSGQSLGHVQEMGMKFNEIPEDQVARIREHVAAVYDRHAETIGTEVVERMLSTLDELRQ
jgi:TRAP-type transport system periplasmic protein